MTTNPYQRPSTEVDHPPVQQNQFSSQHPTTHYTQQSTYYAHRYSTATSPYAAQVPPNQIQGPAYYPYASRVVCNAPLVWALGLLEILFPIFGTIPAGIVMALVGNSKRKASIGTDLDNTRKAANWGITIALAQAIVVTTHFTTLYIMQTGTGFFPFGLFGTIMGLIWVINLVICVIGIFRSSKSRYAPPCLPIV